MTVIKILGSGCSNCKKVEALAHEAAAELNLAAEFEKITDYDGIHAYPILATPGLVINEKVVCAGRIPRKEEIVAWLQKAVETK